ncbi:MAG: diaminopimelate decarboxylase [Thermoflexales bacterium]|nr:diaminopimelate decarboxylase [Thermoflexales bacterium]
MNTSLLHEIAERVGTPCYVYDADRIRANYHALASAFPGAGKPVIHFAVKANGNLSVLRLLRELGAGFDVVSGGEMHRALRAGARPESIVFAGVGKTDAELVDALAHGIGWINVESAQELRVLSDLAVAHGRVQRVALRLNPGVDPHTHDYMSTGKSGTKFGVEPATALDLIARRRAFPGVAIEGVHFHIGSMVFEPEPYLAALDVALDVITRARAMGAEVDSLDMGGGFGIPYTADQVAAPVAAMAAALLPRIRAAQIDLHLEPGRFLVADAGVLLTRVLYTKQSGGTDYVIVDAAMNDLIRPALYGATHQPAPLDPPTTTERRAVELVGPVCESGDFLAHSASLPPLTRGQLLTIANAGAYGMSMASNYNTRPRGAEVMVEGGAWRVIRPRETLDHLMAGE